MSGVPICTCPLKWPPEHLPECPSSGAPQEPRTGGGERKTPVLLRVTPLGKRVVAITNYTTRSNGVIRAKDGGKHDVTNDFLDLARELGMDITPALDALGLQEVTNA